MRIALVTPYCYPSTRGNAVTVERIASGLRERGYQVGIYSLEAFQDRREVPSAIRDFGPDLVHGFHAFVTGDLVVAEARRHVYQPWSPSPAQTSTTICLIPSDAKRWSRC